MLRAMSSLPWVMLIRMPRAVWRGVLDRIATELFLMASPGSSRDISISYSAQIMYPARIRLEAGCRIGPRCVVVSERKDASLVMGPNVNLVSDVHLDFSGDVSLGPDAFISEGAIVYSHDHGRDPRSFPRFTPLSIDAGVWVGARAIILPGVGLVGRGATVGAGSVVTKPCPDGAVVVGASSRTIIRES